MKRALSIAAHEERFAPAIARFRLRAPGPFASTRELELLAAASPSACPVALLVACMNDVGSVMHLRSTYASRGKAAAP